MSSVAPPTTRNGRIGIPGTRQSASAEPPPICSARLWAPSWAATVLPMSASPPERVTIRPVATDSSSAGICETRPSPTLSRLYVVIASAGDMPRCTMPTMNPPIRLIRVMTMAAMASPLTNFDAPSIEP
jgi:hypothetical protein